jgi:hypothetical protein
MPPVASGSHKSADSQDQSSQTARLAGLGAGLLLAACASPVPDAPPPSGPTIAYRLTYDPAVPGARWILELEASGLAPTGAPLELRLDDWGEWTQVDSYHLPFLTCDPPALRAEEARERFVVQVPPGWDGRLSARYAIAVTELGSNAREAHGLLPSRAPSYCLGFTSNTLVELESGGAPVAAERTLSIDVPADWTIATGFGGVSIGHQSARIPAHFRNSAIAFGKPMAIASAQQGAQPIEIVQWGGEQDVTAPLERFARTFVAECTQSTGQPPTGPIRLLVTEPGAGGTRVDGAFVIGCPDLLGPAPDPYTLHFLAHEIFHDWLGGRLRPATKDESLAWFWEGFTEYLSLWHLAKSELVPRAWFVERLFDYDRELRDLPAWRTVAFADPAVAWRADENEPVAYKGSALLAFSLDVALRRAGGAGLVELIRDLLAEPDGEYSLELLETWLEVHGQGELWRRSFAGVERPDLRADLASIGYAERVPVQLSYVGLGVNAEGDVTAIDPDGPAASAGFQLGDRIFGRSPRAAVKPQIGSEVTTSYRFGLDGFEPGQPGAFVDVRRGSQELRIALTPRLIPGGYRAGLAPGDPRTAEFFR